MSSHHHDIYIHLLYSIAREKSKKYTLFSLYRLTMFFFVMWYCVRIQKKHSSWLCFLCFFHKLLNKLVCNLFHSRQILDWIFWQTIQFFDFLFVHYKIQSKSKLKTMHNVMKNIEQNMIHQYIKHHKHHQTVSFIFISKKNVKGLTVETKSKATSESHFQVYIFSTVQRTLNHLHSIFQHQSCLFHTIVQWTNIFCSIFQIRNIAFCFHLVLVLSLGHCSFQSRTDSTNQRVSYSLFALSSSSFDCSSDKISDFNCL